MEPIEQILRIRAMELIFQDLLQAAETGTFYPESDSTQRKKLQLLIDYYESPLWLSDYEADERGELPKELKRGILSEDGFYDFLTDHSSNEE